jgi:chromosome segregation ATPase
VGLASASTEAIFSALSSSSVDDQALHSGLQSAQTVVSPSPPVPPGGAPAPATVEPRFGGIDHGGEAASFPGVSLDRLERLARQRDEARAGFDELLRKARRLRTALARSRAQVARLRQSRERVRAIRAKCDLLHAERASLDREVTRIQSRLTEAQVALVGVEAELEDQRSRAHAERQAWQAQLRDLLGEAASRQAAERAAARRAEALQLKVTKLRGLYDETRQQRDQALEQVGTLGQRVATLGERCARLSAYLDEAEAERRQSDQGYRAEIDRLNSLLGEALEEAEAALERDASSRAQIARLQARLARRTQALAAAD